MHSPNALAPTVPLKPLVLLSVAVLLVHVLLLRSTALHLSAPSPGVQRFTVRTLPPKLATFGATPPVDAGAVTRSPASDRTPAPALAAPSRTSQRAPSPSTTQPAQSATASTSPNAVTLTLPAPMRVNYTVHGEVRMLRFDSQASLQWQHDGQHYDAQFSSGGQLQGPRVQTSHGLITAQGLKPLRFADKLRSEVAAHFEHAQQRISFSANTPDALLQADAQDQLSMVVQLAAWAKAEPTRFAPGNTLALQVASAREADVWVFVVEGEETVHTPLGDMPSLKLTRTPQKNFDVRLTVWLAPALSYLPARMRWTQMNGDTVEQLFSGLDQPSAP